MINVILFHSLYGFGLGKRAITNVNGEDTSTQVPIDSHNYGSYERGMCSLYHQILTSSIECSCFCCFLFSALFEMLNIQFVHHEEHYQLNWKNDYYKMSRLVEDPVIRVIALDWVVNRLDLERKQEVYR